MTYRRSASHERALFAARSDQFGDKAVDELIKKRNSVEESVDVYRVE